MLGLPAESPGAFVLLVVAGAALVFFLARGLQRVGFTLFETILLGAAPLVAAVDADLFAMERGMLAVNVAGFVIPFLITAKVLVERRAPLLQTLACTIVVAVVAFVASYPVPGRGVLLHYQAPAIAACAVTLAVVRTRFDRAGPVAFASGSMGVVIGADVAHLGELLASGPVSRVVVGGAGVLDGIFLVGILGLFLVAFVAGAWSTFEAHARKTAERDAAVRTPAPPALVPMRAVPDTRRGPAT